MSAENSPSKLELQKALVRKLVELPQASVIKPEDAQRIIANLATYHADRASWHIDRMRGFGGSEMAAILIEFVDRHRFESSFSSAASVIDRKLCMRTPEFETEHMKRGTVLEELAQRVFHIKYKCESDHEALAALRDPSQVIAEHPWLVGNPDDAIRIGGKLYLPDYKVPRIADDTEEFQYKTQIHHYALRAELLPKPVPVTGGMLIVKLNLPTETQSLLVQNWPNYTPDEKERVAQHIASGDGERLGFGLTVVKVERDPQLMQDILVAGDAVWNRYVLEGRRLEAYQAPEVWPQDRLDQMIAKEKEIARLREMSEHLAAKLDNELAEFKESFGDILKGLAANKSVASPLVFHTYNNDVSTKVAVERAKEFGIEPEAYSKATEPNVDAMRERLKELGEDPDAPEFKTPKPDRKLVLKALAEVAGAEAIMDESVNLRAGTSAATKRKREEVREEVAHALDRLFESSYEPEATSEDIAYVDEDLMQEAPQVSSGPSFSP